MTTRSGDRRKSFAESVLISIPAERLGHVATRLSRVALTQHLLRARAVLLDHKMEYPLKLVGEQHAVTCLRREGGEISQ